ncbi:MAG: hypothetical protein AAFR31_11115 [Cyanobacteria bacterium J06627_8]
MSDKRLSIQQLASDRQLRAGDDPKRLEHFGYKVFSQADEDGILDEIFKRIGITNKVFVEFGVEIGEENNTRYLLEQGWTGLWIESLPAYAAEIRRRRRQDIIDGRLKFIEAKVTVENINELIASAGIYGEIDLLSIDIDSNDYPVYEAISVIRPRVLCIEHNPEYPPPQHYVMPYNPDYRWDYKDGSYGASIKSLEELAERKGMVLVGCGLYSPNGFYIRRDLVNPDLFSTPFSCERFFNALNIDKILGFPRDEARFHQISVQNQEQSSRQNLNGRDSTSGEKPQDVVSLKENLEKLQAQFNHAQKTIEKRREKVKRLNMRRKKLRHKLDEAKQEIQAMKTSKFWILRTQWFRFKRLLGLSSDR